MNFHARLSTFALVLAFALPTYAQLARTFVASTGSDANACSRTAPCRNFAAAVAAVAAGGEVVVLDSAGYGPVSITKSVSIPAPGGVYAGISASTGDAIAVNGTATTVVALRGLTMTGLGATNGIAVTAVGNLHVTGCSISAFATYGINFASGGLLFVDDTLLRENREGVLVAPPVGAAAASIDHCRAEANTSVGFHLGTVTPGSLLTVRDSIAALGSYGVLAYGSEIDLKNCLISYNSVGAYATNSGTVAVDDSMFTTNGYGLDNNGGTITTFGTNSFTGNSVATTGTITTVSRQ